MEAQSEAIRKAADLILAADFMIIATGAGLSADSGLPVYRDTQKVEAYLKRDLTYMDLCRPDLNFEDPETFYGFWGSSMKQFREAVPHEGYTILKKWKEQLFAATEKFSEKLQEYETVKGITDPPGPVFVFTSNVDALHLKAGYKKNEIFEIHGNIETWQCSNKCRDVTWSAPRDFVFEVDPATMLAAKEKTTGEEKLHYSENNGFVSNHPRCKFCGDHSRPAILMFADFYWARTKSLWDPWRNTVKDLLGQDPALNLVIVEVGCGKNVPSVRYMGEYMIGYFPQQTKIIRINRDFIEPDFTENPECVLGIQGSGRTILRAIDDVIQSQLEQAREKDATLQPANLQVPANLQIPDLQPNLQAHANLQVPDLEEKNNPEDADLAYEMQTRAKLE